MSRPASAAYVRDGPVVAAVCAWLQFFAVYPVARRAGRNASCEQEGFVAQSTQGFDSTYNAAPTRSGRPSRLSSRRAARIIAASAAAAAAVVGPALPASATLTHRYSF